MKLDITKLDAIINTIDDIAYFLEKMLKYMISQYYPTPEQ